MRGILPETAFFNCENLPEEMSAQFDRPWNYLGDVTVKHPHLRAVCEKCRQRKSKLPMMYCSSPKEPYAPRLETIEMPGQLFITDDMLEVIVYFGVCKTCGSVYWAKQGPPFRRVRSYCHVAY